MCRPASFVLTKKQVFFSMTSNHHDEIIREHKLVESGIRGVNILRVEIATEDYDLPIDKWEYNVDQDILPDWIKGNEEKRTRKALLEWKKHHCVTQDKGNFQVGGFKVIQKAEDKSTQTAGDKSTQMAEGFSTQTAGFESTQAAGDYSTQTAGYDSTQTAGFESTQTAGYDSTQTAGDASTQTAGDKSTQTAEGFSTQTAGFESTQAAGDYSTQTAGDMSTQTAGNNSTQTAEYKSTQTAGDMSTQTAGNNSTQTAGYGSVQITRWLDGYSCKTASRIIGEKEANRPYKVNQGIWKLVG